MNSLERTRCAMRMQPVDYVPTFPILLAPACQLLGVKQRDYFLDPAVMADTLLRARDLLDTDGIYVSRDNWIYHQALGGRMVFPEDDESYATEVLLPNLADFRRLPVPVPEKAPGMKTVLEAARRVVAAAGDRCYIQANIDCGPFSTAAILRGAQAFLLDLTLADESLLRELLDFCTEVVVAYGRAMMATGVHGIQFGDATASLVNREHYAKFVLPYQQKAVAALAGRGCDVWIHICGNSKHLLPFLQTLDIQGFEVDAKVDLSAARQLLGGKIALKGNLDTSLLLQGSAAEVENAARQILAREDMQTGLILSPGCGVPRMTPLENLRAMVRACRNHRPS